jgi:plasmid stabilization system protein ParE
MVERGAMAKWSPEALFDLDQIWDYYERVAGRDIAEKIIRKSVK